jgi:hypothetical protein
MYVLRKAQKSVVRKNLRLKLLGCLSPILAYLVVALHKNSTISVHTPVMFKPQQASQQNTTAFFTLEVQLTASKGTTTHSQPRLSIRKGAFLR